MSFGVGLVELERTIRRARARWMACSRPASLNTVAEMA